MKEVKKNRVMFRVLAFFGLTIALLAIFMLTFRINGIGTIEGHTLMELATSLMALFVGVIALVRYLAKHEDKYLFVSSAFLGTGLLDAYHAFMSSGAMFSGTISEHIGAVEWTWEASRIFLGAVLLIMMVVVAKREHEKQNYNRETLFTIFFVAFVLFLLSIMYYLAFSTQQMYFIDSLIGRPFDLVSAPLYILALVIALRRLKWRSEVFEFWMILSLITAPLVQLVFMPFSFALFDVQFMMAHVLKMLSYVFVMFGLLASMYETFVKVEVYAKEVEARNKMLADAQLDSEKEVEKDRELMRALEGAMNRAEESKDTVERMNASMTGRELKMVDLKTENRKLKADLRSCKQELLQMQYEAKK